MAFTKKEMKLINDPYFELIKETDQFMEIKSVDTGHCWNVFKNTIEAGKHVVLYHKHSIEEIHYQKHKECRTVTEAVDIIKTFDAYLLERKNRTIEGNMPDRRLRVYAARDKRNKTVPQIRLQGKWLEELGFEPGTSYTVKCEDGKLILISE